jgi:DNA-binding XRE family transcriptional regulator
MTSDSGGPPRRQPQTVSDLEKGRYDPSLPLAFRLAHVFSTPIEDPFTPSPDDLLGSTAASAASTTSGP